MSNKPERGTAHLSSLQWCFSTFKRLPFCRKLVFISLILHRYERSPVRTFDYAGFRSTFAWVLVGFTSIRGHAEKVAKLFPFNEFSQLSLCWHVLSLFYEPLISLAIANNAHGKYLDELSDAVWCNLTLETLIQVLRKRNFCKCAEFNNFKLKALKAQRLLNHNEH